jgi:hypothetical protein
MQSQRRKGGKPPAQTLFSSMAMCFGSARGTHEGDD